MVDKLQRKPNTTKYWNVTYLIIMRQASLQCSATCHISYVNTIEKWTKVTLTYFLTNYEITNDYKKMNI